MKTFFLTLTGLCAVLSSGCKKEPGALPEPVPVTRIPSPFRPGQMERVVTLKGGQEWFVQQDAGPEYVAIMNDRGELTVANQTNGNGREWLGPESRVFFQSPGRAYAVTQRGLWNGKEKIDCYYDVDGDGLPEIKDHTDGRSRLVSVEWEKIGDAATPDPKPDDYPDKGRPLVIEK